MATPPPQASLSPNQMSEVARRVPCEWDRIKMALACRSWRSGLAAPPPPPPPPALPQLLLPSVELTRVHLILSDRITHHQQQYRDLVGARYFGSYHGGCLFVEATSYLSRRHRLVDLQKEKVRLLPDVVCPLYNPSDKHVHGTTILAATLSSPPDDPGCVAAGIVTYQLDDDNSRRRRRRCAFWRMGDRVAYDTLPPRRDLEDVVHHDNHFAFLTDEEHILTCWPAFYQDEDEPRRGDSVQATLRCFEPRDRSREGYIRARYLLESRGNLLMVIRFAPDHGSLTSGFKIFSAAGPFLPEDDASGSLPWYQYLWSELDTLDGRMLFLGRGCSRSYNTADYPGFNEGIFFLDDRSFHDHHTVSRGYRCNDIGKWTPAQPPNDVQLFFPDQVPSKHSSPGWLLI